MSKLNAGMMTSKTDDWATPASYFAIVSDEFGPFDVDVCADSANAKAAKFFDRETNGLAQDWSGLCWMNHPYGKEIGAWMAKAKESASRGATVVCLVPSRTDTRWWHESVQGHAEVRFIRGRLKFGGAKNSAPFPSALVVYRPEVK